MISLVYICSIFLLVLTLVSANHLEIHFPGEDEACTMQKALGYNAAFVVTNKGIISNTVQAGSRNVALGGSKNSIGNDAMPIVNSLVTGCGGSVRHSTSGLFAYQGRPVGSHRNFEFRVAALNGAWFSDTQLTAASLLIQDDVTQRVNQSSLSAYLINEIATTATDVLSGIDTYRYRWDNTYSPETRWRYGVLPAEITDESISSKNHTYKIETTAPGLLHDDGECQLDIGGTTVDTVVTTEAASLDLVSLVTMLVESIKELNARIVVLEAAV